MGYDSVSPVGLDEGNCHGCCGCNYQLGIHSGRFAPADVERADGEVVRRLCALALVLEGHSRTQAAEQNGMDRQTLIGLELARAGAHIALKGLGEPDQIEQLRDEMAAINQVQVIYVPADLSQPEHAMEMVQLLSLSGIPRAAPGPMVGHCRGLPLWPSNRANGPIGLAWLIVSRVPPERLWISSVARAGRLAWICE